MQFCVQNVEPHRLGSSPYKSKIECKKLREEREREREKQAKGAALIDAGWREKRRVCEAEWTNNRVCLRS